MTISAGFSAQWRGHDHPGISALSFEPAGFPARYKDAKGRTSIASLDTPKTMTSREIAALTGKAHKDVLRDARNLMEALDIGMAQFSAMHTDSNGRDWPMFVLPKRETLILVAGYSVPMRAKIIDRWQELERVVAEQCEL